MMIEQFMNNIVTKAHLVHRKAEDAVHIAFPDDVTLVFMENEITGATYSYGLNHSKSFKVQDLIGLTFNQARAILIEHENAKEEFNRKHSTKKAPCGIGIFGAKGYYYD